MVSPGNILSSMLAESVRIACNHCWEETSRHPDYEQCALCKTLHSKVAVVPEKLYLHDYWSESMAHSSIREQVYNVDVHEEFGRTKNQYVLEHLCPVEFDAVLEIACAPGSLLAHLNKAGYKRVVGVDADAAYEKDIREISGHEGELIFGLFPACTSHLEPESFSLIVGLDIFEHAHEPMAFLEECHRLLKPAGQLFLMTPIVSPWLPDRFLHPVEHVYIHSVAHLATMLMLVGFIPALVERWTSGHETISTYKK